MKKFGLFILLVFAATILAGLYGAIHNQVTFTISNEYFTEFKYDQFGFDPNWFGGHRPTVAIIGFLASWWTGFFIGVILSLTGLLHKDAKAMLKFTIRAILIVLMTVFLFGFFGYVYALIAITDLVAFDIAGSIHNFGYLGGLVGLIIGVCYQVYQWRRKRATG